MARTGHIAHHNLQPNENVPRTRKNVNVQKTERREKKKEKSTTFPLKS